MNPLTFPLRFFREGGGSGFSTRFDEIKRSKIGSGKKDEICMKGLE